MERRSVLTFSLLKQKIKEWGEENMVGTIAITMIINLHKIYYPLFLNIKSKLFTGIDTNKLNNSLFYFSFVAACETHSESKCFS